MIHSCPVCVCVVRKCAQHACVDVCSRAFAAHSCVGLCQESFFVLVSQLYLLGVPNESVSQFLTYANSVAGLVVLGLQIPLRDRGAFAGACLHAQVSARSRCPRMIVKTC